MAHKKKGELTVSELVEAYRCGDEAARDLLIEMYMSKAEEIALEYSELGVDDDDLIQSAYEGLIRAIDKSRERTLKNYASFFIKQIHQQVRNTINRHYRFIEEKNDDKRICSNRMLIELLKAKRDMCLELEREPSSSELSERTGFDGMFIENALNEIDFVVSLEDVSFVLASQTAEDLIVDPEFEVLYRDYMDSLRKDFRYTEKELMVIEYLKAGVTNQSEIARRLGFSRQRVIALINQIAKKMKMTKNAPPDSTVLKSAINDELVFIKKSNRDRQHNRNRNI